MGRLSRVQTDFQEFLRAGDRAVEAHVVGTERVPIATRLNIYADAYRSRLIEALQANFPVLAEWLGETDFDTLGQEYVRTHDSTFASIRYYGEGLSQFLSEHPDYRTAPVLAELARWEWTLTEVFDAADADPIDSSALARIAPDHWADLRFQWHPSLRALDLWWNVPQIWKASVAQTERLAPELSAEPTRWMLWRQDLHSYFRSLSPLESVALDAARTGESFGELCVRLCDHVEELEAPARVAGFLRDWVSSGLVIAAH
jgi:hypothetical protein